MVLAVVALVLNAAWRFTCGFGTSTDPVQSAEEAKRNEAERVRRPPIPIFITASRLGREYAENEVAADLKYRRKELCVKGTVENTGLDASENNNPYVVLESILPVRCSFDKFYQKFVAEMRPRSVTEICGDVSPKGIWFVQLEGCVPLSPANRQLRDQAVERYRARAKDCPNFSEVLKKGTRREMAKCMKEWDTALDPAEVCRNFGTVSGHDDPEVIKAKKCHYEACLAEGIGKDMCPMK